MFKVPVSRKTVAGAVGAALAGAVGALLNAVGLYSVPADIQGFISSGEALAGAYAAAWATGDGVTYANYLLGRLGLSKTVEVVEGEYVQGSG